ncbi:DUF397 domain-containing protein [Actinomadura macra]|uniref:DUF397 domain-containing protein n=1 Tax=Actinomadura macra TaxID=46164 RepID=UPI0009FFB503|nr:DUF397 domain-containing protein [Actinomadura macra]
MERIEWRKSSRSTTSGECVEVANLDASAVSVRDSKFPDAVHLTFCLDVWATFADAVKTGRYDRP